jgi:hypothetical protein
MKAKGERWKAKGLGLCHCAALASRLLATSAFLLSPSALLFAAHPFITDDADTQGRGNWQIELQAEQGRHDATVSGVRQRTRETLFNPVLTYGVLENVEVALGGNYLRSRVSENGASTESASGISDTTIEIKWNFSDKDGFSMALKPGISLPTGDEQRGLGTGKISGGVNFIVGYEAEPWTWLANVEYFRARYRLGQDAADNRANLWRMSTGAAYEVREGARLVGEAGVRTNEARNDPFFPGRHAQYAMLGLIYSPTDKIDFDIGWRKALNRAETDTVFLVGATFRW